jgi:tetratricopeptide (TPR) repeat protein
MAAGAALRNRPVRIYTAGFQTYKKGVRLLQEGKSPEAKKYLLQAIAIMEPLIDERASRDHRDVINSLLITAMCHEKLADYSSAEKRYRTLINEYPHSRYVGEGYVKLARICKWQAIPLWQQGLNLSRLGENKKGAEVLRQGLKLMERSLDYYAMVPEKEPYSNWVRYALEDLEREKRYLKNALKELTAIRPDVELRDRLEKLLEGVKAR